jgi:ferredoxin, 2Fe-2S
MTAKYRLILSAGGYGSAQREVSMQTSTGIRTVTVIDDVGEHLLDLDSDASLLQLLQDNGVSVAAVCGGCMSCGTCHVMLTPELYARLVPPTPDETILLEESRHYLPGSSRLACQISAGPTLAGMTVRVAPDE